MVRKALQKYSHCFCRGGSAGERQMRKRTWIIVLLVICILGSAAWCVYLQEAGNKEKQQTEVAKITTEELPPPSAEEIMFESCSRLVENCTGIDGEFSKWLYSYYGEAVTAVLDRAEGEGYTERLWYEETGKSLFVLRDEYQGLSGSGEVAEGNLIYEKSCKNENYVNLAFAGDVSFANDYLPSQNYTNQGIDGAFDEGIQAVMQNADIFMVNNEFCYTKRGNAVPKGYNFRAEPGRVKRLMEMGVDIVSIANNHAYDYGEEGFVDTIKTLDDAGMPYVGGGTDLEDAKSHIVYFIANGIKIGYIAATQVERDLPVFTQPATKDSPGVVRCFEPDMVNEMIREAKKRCDFVIVYPHWGTERMKETQEDQRALAHSFIDAGADAVIGGHPHCLQGAEYYKGVPICYSLSNFSFSSRIVDSVILNLKITIDGIQEAKYIPCMEYSGKTILCEKGDGNYERIIGMLGDYSTDAEVDGDGVLQKK